MSSRFSILVTGSPTSSQAHFSALRFIEAAIRLGHAIDSVFFYQDAVTVASSCTATPTDEVQLSLKWSQIAKEHGFELQVCIAAANRRAVISDEEAVQHGIPAGNLAAGFLSLGLTQLVTNLSRLNSPKAAGKFIHFK